MTLSSMVVSRDWQEVSVLECILGGLHMDVAVESEPQKAMARLNRSKIDALIVDCDLNGTGQFLRELQMGDSRVNTVPLVIMGAPQGKRDMAEHGRDLRVRQTNFRGASGTHALGRAQHDSGRAPPLPSRGPGSSGQPQRDLTQTGGGAADQCEPGRAASSCR